MLLQVMRATNNYFTNECLSETGEFKIDNEVLSGFKGKYPVGSYIAVEAAESPDNGSKLNAGIYSVSDDLITLAGAKNEEWHGRIFLCTVPQDFVDLVAEIEQSQASVNDAGLAGTGVTSVTVGGYHKSMATDSDGLPATWQALYKNRLRLYMKPGFKPFHI